jgi:ribosomal protein L9
VKTTNSSGLRKVLLDEPIKQLGEFKVPVRLHHGVTASPPKSPCKW